MYSYPTRALRPALLLLALTAALVQFTPAEAAVLDYNRQHTWVLTEGTPFEEPELNPHVPTDIEDVKVDDDGDERLENGSRPAAEEGASPFAKWIRKVVGFRVVLPGVFR